MYERPLIQEEYNSQEEELTCHTNQKHIHVPAGTSNSLEKLSNQEFSVVLNDEKMSRLQTKIDNEIEMNENPTYFLQRKRPQLLLQNEENELHNDTVRVT